MERLCSTQHGTVEGTWGNKDWRLSKKVNIYSDSTHTSHIIISIQKEHLLVWF